MGSHWMLCNMLYLSVCYLFCYYALFINLFRVVRLRLAVVPFEGVFKPLNTVYG